MAEEKDALPKESDQKNSDGTRSDESAADIDLYEVPLKRGPRQSKDPNQLLPGGMGIFLAKILQDNVWVRRDTSSRETPETSMPMRHGINGELWEYWGATASELKYVTDQDLAKTRHILVLIALALVNGDAAIFDRMNEAIGVLSGLPETETESEKLVRYLRAVSRLIEKTRKRESPEARLEQDKTADLSTTLLMSDDFYHRERYFLEVYHDPRFEDLNVDLFRETLMSAAHDPQRRGGRSQRGPAYIAAELAVDVNAFDAATGNGSHDDKVRAFRDRLQKEKSNFEKARKKKLSVNG